MTVGRPTEREDPTMLILLGLGVLWAAVLVPPMLRSSQRVGASAVTVTLVAAGQRIRATSTSTTPAVGSVPQWSPPYPPEASDQPDDAAATCCSFWSALGGVHPSWEAVAVGGFVPWTAHFIDRPGARGLHGAAHPAAAAGGRAGGHGRSRCGAQYVPCWITPALAEAMR